MLFVLLIVGVFVITLTVTFDDHDGVYCYDFLIYIPTRQTTHSFIIITTTTITKNNQNNKIKK